MCFSIVASSYLIGHIFFKNNSTLNKISISHFIFSTGIGLSILILFLTILGYLGFFNRIIIKIILNSLTIGFLLKIYIHRKYFKKIVFRSFDFEHAILLTVFLIISTLYLLSSLTPTLDGDSLFGYLSLAREYSTHSKIIPIDYYYGSTFPQNGQLLATLGFLLNDQITAQLVVSWLMGILCCITTFSFGKMIGNAKSGLIAVIIFYGTFSVAFLNQSAKVDLAWAFFDLLGIYAFFNWYFDQNNSRNNNYWLLFSGILLGTAIGVKQVSAFTIIIIFFVIIIDHIFKCRTIDFRLLKKILFFCIPIILSFHWIVRSYLLSGSFLYTASELINNNGIIGFFKTIWEMSMTGNAVSHEGPHGKYIGPILLGILPLFLITKKLIIE